MGAAMHKPFTGTPCLRILLATIRAHDVIIIVKEKQDWLLMSIK